MSKSVLVLGANGNVGRPLVRALLAAGQQVKAASRSGDAVEGAPGVCFDYMSPDSYGPAIEGIDRAYVMLPAGYTDSKGMLQPLIAFLAERKIKVVLQSVFGVDADDSIPYRQVELQLEKSNTPYVILRPNWFMDNFHTFWKSGITRGQLLLPAGDGSTSFIDARDIAACAAAALLSDRFGGQSMDLTGPEPLSYAAAAAVLSTKLGKPVAYQAVTDAAFVTMLVSAGVPTDYAEFLASIFYPVRESWTARVTDCVQQLTGQPARSLRQYAQDYFAQLSA